MKLVACQCYQRFSIEYTVIRLLAQCHLRKSVKSVSQRTFLAFVRTSTLHGHTWRVLERNFAVLSVKLSCGFLESLQQALK
jgi:hypothetical protein